MAQKCVVIYENGSISGGQRISVPDTLDELLSKAFVTLNIKVEKLFRPNGTVIRDTISLCDNDVLYASVGEAFKPLYQLKPCISEWLTLNVGGRMFTTTRNTLTLKEPQSMLARMFAGGEQGYLYTPSDSDASGAFLIDRNPRYFEVILNFLRTGKLIHDSHVSLNGILEEARFFGIESLVEQVQDIIEKKATVGDNVRLSRNDVIQALIRSAYTTELRFQGINLSRSDLSKLDLRYINFKFANLSHCNLSASNLSYCNLERADLSYAHMDGAQLLGIKCLCANLKGASMKNCNLKDPAGSRANMEGVNLKNANLEGSDMGGVNLRVATLKNANLKNCDLRAAVLAGADLESCILSGSDLQEANLRGANLNNTSFDLMVTPLHMSQTIR